jgi:PAS domain S-box-containing protein
MAKVESEAELKASEEKFSKAFKSSSSLLAISTLDQGLFIDVNDSFLDILEYNRDEVIGKTSSELNIFLEWDDRQQATEILMKEGRIRGYEVKVQTKSGKVRWGSFSAIIINLQDQDYLLTIMTDITSHKETEMREEFLRTVLRHDIRNKNHKISSYLNLLLKSELSIQQISLIEKALKVTKEVNQLSDQ